MNEWYTIVWIFNHFRVWTSSLGFVNVVCKCTQEKIDYFAWIQNNYIARERERIFRKILVLRGWSFTWEYCLLVEQFISSYDAKRLIRAQWRAWAEEGKGLFRVFPSFLSFFHWDITTRFTMILQLQLHQHSVGHMSDSTVQFPCFLPIRCFLWTWQTMTSPQRICLWSLENILEDRWSGISLYTWHQIMFPRHRKLIISFRYASDASLIHLISL